MDMLQRLRRVNENDSLEEMIALEAFGKATKQGFETRQIETPAWLDDSLRTLALEIQAKSRDELMRRLREARARKASLLSRDERRALADQEVARLEKILGVEEPEPTPTVTP